MSGGKQAQCALLPIRPLILDYFNGHNRLGSKAVILKPKPVPKPAPIKPYTPRPGRVRPGTAAPGSVGQNPQIDDIDVKQGSHSREI